LLHALKHPDSDYAIADHQAAHRVTYATARSDLLGLGELGLLHKRQQGKAFLFRPVVDLARRLER
jgi:Fic family protein